MNALAQRFIAHTRRNGLRSATKRSLKYLSASHEPVVQGLNESAPDAPRKIDLIGHYAQILGHAHGLGDMPPTSTKRGDSLIQWVIPNFGFGSGGHLNIFRFINLLADAGFPQRLVILPPHNWDSVASATDTITRWYFPLKAEIALGVGGFRPASATFATGWQTAYWVHHHEKSRRKFYFVQDHEPDFYARSSETILAENTYRLGLTGITAGTWLKKKLAQDYAMKCHAVSFACDTEFYQPTEKRANENFNILFYARHVTPRRLFELGLLALAEACKRHPDIAVIFAGGDVGRYQIPFHHLNAGELTLKELPDLYSQCDLSLVLSGTNLSLLPLELAACRCPIVLNDSPSANWLLPRGAAFYAKPSVEDLSRVITRAYSNEKQRNQKRDKAFDIAMTSSWSNEAQKIIDILERAE